MRLPLCFLLKASAQLLCWDSGSHADNNQAVRKTACARAETLLLQKLLPSHHPPPPQDPQLAFVFEGLDNN